MRFLGTLSVAAAFFILSSLALRAQSGITEQNGRAVTCASDDGGRHMCRVDTSRGVVMTRQRSGSPCTQGQTWGYNRDGIWVDRGCRADFWLDARYNGGGGGGNRPPQQGQTITCSSNDGKRNFCSANTSRGVRMINQRSGSPCTKGETWGYNQNAIWVDRGCRADFSVGGW